MVLTIAERSGRATSQVRIHSKTDRIPLDFNPQMTACIRRPPTKNDQRIILLKTATTFERIAIQRLEHLGQTAFLQNASCIFAHSLPLRLVYLSLELLIARRTYLSIRILRIRNLTISQKS